MSDIIVTIPKGYFDEVYYHKTHYCVRTRKPKDLEEGDRIFFVYQGIVESFHPFEGFTDSMTCEVTAKKWSGTNLKLGRRFELSAPFVKMKGFRGFRYVKNLPDNILRKLIRAARESVRRNA